MSRWNAKAVLGFGSRVDIEEFVKRFPGTFEVTSTSPMRNYYRPTELMRQLTEQTSSIRFYYGPVLHNVDDQDYHEIFVTTDGAVVAEEQWGRMKKNIDCSQVMKNAPSFAAWFRETFPGSESPSLSLYTYSVYTN